MAAQAESVKKSEEAPLMRVGEGCGEVARQPILNQSGRLHAYELLFRHNPAAAGHDGEGSIGAIVDDTVVFGLEQFTNGFPAFVACSAEALTGQLVRILPAAITVLAISESVETSPELVEACRDLKSRGFRLAVDDFTSGENPLLEMAAYVRVDFSQAAMSPEQYRARLGGRQPAMVAKKVETEEDYRRASAEGFTLFQGDYLFRPSPVTSRKVPANRLFHFEILQSLYREPVDLIKLSRLVMREASLTYRLLRLVNSPVCALRQEVRSVESALIIVGIDTFRRIATLAILGEADCDRQPEILHMAFVRARFCEQAARVSRLDPDEQYLLGLFSLLPAMLRVPMSEVAPTMPLRDAVREALEGMENRERCLLSWLERHEHGAWAACDEIVRENRLSNERLIQCYAEAVVWAHEAQRSGGTGGGKASRAG